MKRRALLAACTATPALAAAGCLAPRLDDAMDDGPVDVDAVRDWPMFLHDARNRRCFAGARHPADSPRWTYETDDAIWSSPVVANGIVYIGSYDGHLYALSADDGELRWRYRTGDRVDGTPAVANDTVYVGSFDRNVYALDARTGEERWVYGTEGIVRSSPTVVGDTVYVGSHCRAEECAVYYDVRWPAVGYVLALDAATGDLRWRYRAGDGILAKPAVAEETVFVGGSDSTLYALDAAGGDLRWQFDAAGQLMASPTCSDGRVYVGDLSGQLHALAIDDGEWLWQYAHRREDAVGDIAYELITSSPVVCDETVYVGAMEADSADRLSGMIWAVSTTDATLRWRAGPFGEMVGSSPVLIGDDLYFGAHTFAPSEAYEPGLYALTPGGEVRWRYEVDAGTNRGFGSSLALADGSLFIGGADGLVYAFSLGAANG